jgi:hypothetical protein
MRPTGRHAISPRGRNVRPTGRRRAICQSFALLAIDCIVAGSNLLHQGVGGSGNNVLAVVHSACQRPSRPL